MTKKGKKNSSQQLQPTTTTITTTTVTTNSNNNNITEYDQDTRILLFKVILAQDDETICRVIQIANGLPGLPKISDISKDLGLIILRLPDKTIKQLENFLESKNIYFREQQSNSISDEFDELDFEESQSQQQQSQQQQQQPNLIVINNNQFNNKSKQKRPIQKEETYNKIIENQFDLRLIFNQMNQENNNNNNNNSLSPVFTDIDLFLMDSFIILSDKLENIKPTLEEFLNHYNNDKNLIKYIEEFKDNLIDDHLEIVEILASWYIPQKDWSIIKFLNCFGEMLDSTTIESFCYIFNKSIKKEDDWVINFIQASLNSDDEFRKQIMCLNDELIQDRHDESLYSIMHSIRYDNVREFILIYTRDENYFSPEEFWYLICKYDAVAITQHILNNNIEEEDLTLKSGKSPNSSSIDIFTENPLAINPLSLMEICSANFSHKIASVLFQFYDFQDSMPIKPRLKGVLKPPTTTVNITTTTTTPTTSDVIIPNGQFQYFRVLDVNCYFNEITKKRASIFIDLMTEMNIYMNTEVGEGSDENVESNSIYTFQESTEYLAINMNNIHKLKKSSITLLSKVLEFNDRDILLSLLKNLTQGNCTLCKELIDEKQLLITISRPQYFNCLQILNSNGYTIIPKYQQRDPFIFFSGSKEILEFLLSIHQNSHETIDIRHWIHAIMSAGQYSSEFEFYQYYPKIQELSQKDKYSRTLNILEIQYILGHIEGIEFLLEKYLGFTKPYHLDNQELLEIFDVTFVQKKDIRSQESIQAELDLIEQEEIEKKKLKEKRKKEEREKKKQQQLQQSLKQKSSSPSPSVTSSPIKKDQSPIPPKPTVITIPTPIVPVPTVPTPIKYDVSIGKFKFSRKDEFIIGRGSNGTLVFKGLWNDRIQVAIKQMHKAFNPLISKEIEVLIRLTNKNCNNIVRYIDQEEDDMFVYLGLSLCNGSLQDLVEKSSSSISSSSVSNTNSECYSPLKQFIGTEFRLLELIKDIINGIDFLHQQGIVHNDLNPRNILIKDDRFIISDLGLSKMEVASSYSFTMHAPSGQDGYHPAEVLLEKRKTKKVDIFSLGCILFYLMTNGQHPFGDKFFRMANILTDKSNLESLKHNIVACDLISQMISKNDSDRPSTTTIFQHPLFWNHDKKVKFIDASLNLFKDSNGLFTPKLNKIINQSQDSSDTSTTNTINTPFLSKPWNQLIDQTLIEHIMNKQNQLNNSNASLSSSGKKFYFYDYSQVKDLIRCIRNTTQHHKEIQRLILQSSPTNSHQKQEVLDSLESQESVLAYFEQKIPDLLFFLYLKFKKHLDSKSLTIYFNDIIIQNNK